MSVHRSLRSGGSLVKHRNVLTRAERIKVLEEGGEWREGQSNVLGLRKVKSIKVAGKKKAKKEEAAVPGAAGAPAAAAPAAGSPAAPAAADAKAAAKK
jgi:small basic protein (TIGR04137 family)